MAEKYLDKTGLEYLWDKIEDTVITNAKPGPKGDSGVWLGNTEPTSDYNVWINTDGSASEGLATKTEVEAKQDKLTAGTNITIDENNVISAVGGSSGESGLTMVTLAANDTATYEALYSGTYSLDKYYVRLNYSTTAGSPRYARVLDYDTALWGGGTYYNHVVQILALEVDVGLNYLHETTYQSGSGSIVTKTMYLGKASKSVLGLVKPDGTSITIDDNGTISAAIYTLPAATTSTLGGVKIDNDTIKINDGTISVDKSQLSAANGLPAGGSYPQILMKNGHTDYDTAWANIEHVLNYAGININNTWYTTTSTSESNLYNAKEVVIFWEDQINYYRHQSYLNVGCDYMGNSGGTWGAGNWINTEIVLAQDSNGNNMSITYDGNNVNTNNIFIEAICYKT